MISSLPLSGLDPDQSPEALHDLACCDSQDKVIEDPRITLAADEVKDKIGSSALLPQELKNIVRRNILILLDFFTVSKQSSIFLIYTSHKNKYEKKLK